MAEPAKQRMSLAEFLEWDDGTETRYESIDGRPRTMAPRIEAHGTIVANTVAAIHPAALGDAPDQRYEPVTVVTSEGYQPPE